MVTYSVEVGLQRTGALGGWFGAGQLMEIMRCVREIGADGNRRLAVADAPI